MAGSARATFKACRTPTSSRLCRNSRITGVSPVSAVLCDSVAARTEERHGRDARDAHDTMRCGVNRAIYRLRDFSDSVAGAESATNETTAGIDFSSLDPATRSVAW